MAQMIFVNLHVKDLPKSIEFFEKLGYSFNKQFTNEQAGSLVISDTIYAMLVTEPLFKFFSGKDICDTGKTNEAMLALSVDSRETVDEMLGKALKAGATEARPPQDHGFMYSRGFLDPDGHIWEYFYMDPSHVQQSA